MKKFITTIPLQIHGQLREIKYDSHDNPRLTYDENCSFPILCAMNGYVGYGEHIEIVTISIENDKQDSVTSANYQLFLSQLKRLAEAKGFSYEIVRNIIKKEDDSRDTLIKTYSELIESVSDNDQLFACVTFGTKPVSTLTVMALHYAYRVKEKVDICAIVYGGQRFSIDSNNEVAELYDVTSLFYIDESVESIANLNIKNPEKTLFAMMGIGE